MKVIGIQIEIHQKKVKDSDTTLVSTIYANKENEEIKCYQMCFEQSYTMSYDWPNVSLGHPEEFPDVERFLSNVRYIIERGMYQYSHVYIRGYRDGLRVEKAFCVKNDRSQASFFKVNEMIDLLRIYFSDVSLLKSKVGEEEKVEPAIPDSQAKIIAELQNRVETLSQMQMDTISDLSTRSVKRKAKKRFGIF